jgi:hypothetical protein
MSFTQDPSNANAIINNFVSGALVVPVTTANPSRLSVSPDFPLKSAALRKSAQACMESVGHADRADDLLNGLMNNRLKHDLWYMSLKNGPTIILVQEDVYRQISEREIAEQVHKEEVECAAQRGEFVSDDLLRYYRGKSRPVFSHSSPM